MSDNIVLLNVWQDCTESLGNDISVCDEEPEPFTCACVSNSHTGTEIRV